MGRGLDEHNSFGLIGNVTLDEAWLQDEVENNQAQCFESCGYCWDHQLGVFNMALLCPSMTPHLTKV